MALHARRTQVTQYRSYRSYKRFLREDFLYRCVYCDIHENQHGGYWHFHVEHHKPKSLDRFKYLINEYSNLLYSCDQCNVLKSDSWPSDDPMNDSVGWLDPCQHDLREHYSYVRDGEGFRLIVLTPVGSWMASALALNTPLRLLRFQALYEDEQSDLELQQKLAELVAKAKSENWQDQADLERLLGQLTRKIERRFSPSPYK